jgi:hypothetical protein
MTGEHGVFYRLANHGRIACTLAGYPRIRLYAGGKVMPFRYVFGGPYVTGKPPTTVPLQPGATAWVLVAKYRCDLGVLSNATTISLTGPGVTGALTGPVPRYSGGISALSYCRGGSADPGQVVAVSPFEPTPDAAIRV